MVTTHKHLLRLPGTNLQHLIWDGLRRNFVRNLTTVGLSPSVSNIICKSWKPGTQVTYNTPAWQWLDYSNRCLLNSPLKFLLHSLYESRLSHSATETHRRAISAIVHITGTRGALVSVLVYERKLLPETATFKIQQDQGFQQRVVISQKSWTTKQFTQFTAVDNVNSGLASNISWE